jgi:hypothetical protein
MLLLLSRSVRRIYLIFSLPFEGIFKHIKRTTGSVMTTLYGKRCLPWSGSDAAIYFEEIQLLNNVIDPGAHPPIDLFWPLKYVLYVERWGWAKWKPLCDTTRSVRDALYIRLLEEYEGRLKSKQAVGCYIKTILNNQADLGMTRNEIRYVFSLDFSFRNQELKHMTKFSVD